ncbi:MAG: hypothetical protein ACI4RJ_02840 [Alphaproteobacteria bacterium]
MKKMMIIFCLISTIVKAEIQCEDAGGILAVGGDGQTFYCASKQSMNWWSAFSWCNAVGGKMFDLTTECQKAVNHGPCPQLCNPGPGLSGYYWTTNVADSTYALAQYNSCAFYPEKLSKDRRQPVRALCTMPSSH